MNRVFVFLLMIICNQVSAQIIDSVYIGDQNKLALQGIYSQPVDESLVVLSPISRVSSDENGNFVVTTTNESQVILYDIDGNQIRLFGNVGRGPFEFVKSSNSHIRDGKITLWDHGQLKFIQFDIAGNPLLEITDFRYNIRDFAVSDDNYFVYNSGNFDGPIIEKYSIERNKFEGAWGEPSEEHKVLMLQSKSGDLLHYDNQIYYVSPASLEVNRIDLTTGEIISKSITDPDFEVPEVSNAREIISGDDEILSELFNKTSLVRKLLKVNNYIVVLAETGYFTKSFWGGLDVSTRNLKLYVLDISSLDLIDTFTLPYSLEGTWHTVLDEAVLISSLNLWNPDARSALEAESQYRHIWQIHPYRPK